MAEVLKLRERPREIEARELTRDNIQEISDWIHAEKVDVYEGRDGTAHVVYTFEDEYQIGQDLGWFICKDTRQNVWNQERETLLKDYDLI